MFEMFMYNFRFIVMTIDFETKVESIAAVFNTLGSIWNVLASSMVQSDWVSTFAQTTYVRKLRHCSNISYWDTVPL